MTGWLWVWVVFNVLGSLANIVATSINLRHARRNRVNARHNADWVEALSRGEALIVHGVGLGNVERVEIGGRVVPFRGAPR